MIKLYLEPGYKVKTPEREFGNAGIDFFIPKCTEAFKKAFEDKNKEELAQLCIDENNPEEGTIEIPPHGRVNIPSGVRSFISADIALEAQNKSGIANNRGLVYGASTIDASYKGIIHLSLINTTDEKITLNLGTKIVQFIPRFIDISPIEVYSDIALEEFYHDFYFTNRGEGAFGSTGT